ncbi:MAG TPA: O-antigen ligase family protein [Terriglobales bacterium]|nr:O-antigen ligase family protein [Terriglobales bacterium]
MSRAISLDPLTLACNWPAVLLGIAAAALAAALLWIPGCLPVSIGAAVFTLSFLESECFFLVLIFLQPIDLVSSSIPLVSDASLGVHALAVAGFFFGRMYRRQGRFLELWRADATRASLFFVACIALSAASGFPGLAHEKVRGLYFVAAYFGFYLLAATWLSTAERKCKALRALLTSTVLVGIFAFVQVTAQSYTGLYTLLYELISDEWKGRPPAFLPGPNALAGYLNLILPFAIAVCALSREARWKRLAGAVVVIGAVSLLLTQSRGGYIAFAATVIVAIWHFARDHKRRIVLLLIVALVGSTFYAALLEWNPRHFGEFEDDHSTLARVILWYAAWNLFLASPVHGIGFGTFNFVSENYLPAIADLPENLGVHNIYLELLAEVGVLGLLSFLTVAHLGIRRARKLCQHGDWFQHAIGFGAACGMTAVLVGGFVDHNVLWAPQIGLLFWLWLAMVSAAPTRGERSA